MIKKRSMEAMKMTSRKSIIVVLAILIISCLSPKSYAALSISGVYQGQNIKMSNPVCDDGFGMSITKIVVNGMIVPLKFDGTKAEIDFTLIGIKAGTPVEIFIDYQSNRCPVIYNSSVLSNMLIQFDGKEVIGQTDTTFQEQVLDYAKLSPKREKDDFEFKKPD